MSLLTSCEATLIHVHLCLSFSKQEHNGKQLFGVVKSVVSSALLTSSLNKCCDFSIILWSSLRRVSDFTCCILWWQSWLINARPVSSVCVTMFAAFYIQCRPLLAPMQSSAYTWWSWSTESAGELFPITRNSMTMLAKQSTVDGHFVAVACGYILVHICLTCISGWT